jgi:hypothetical protein
MTRRIKNWREFQHYKHRNPPWIKLHRKILDDREWFNLDPFAAKTLVSLWLIASEGDGELPSVEDLAFRLRISEKHVKSALSLLSHWLEHDASAMLAPRLHDADSETETETETKTKKLHAPSAREAIEEVEPVNEPPKAKLFRVGRTILVSLGVSEKQSGSIIGHWLKEKNDPQGILAALQFARDHVPVGSPIAYVTQLLAKDGNYGNAKKSLADQALELADEARERERRAGVGRSPIAE